MQARDERLQQTRGHAVQRGCEQSRRQSLTTTKASVETETAGAGERVQARHNRMQVGAFVTGHTGLGAGAQSRGGAAAARARCWPCSWQAGVHLACSSRARRCQHIKVLPPPSNYRPQLTRGANLLSVLICIAHFILPSLGGRHRRALAALLRQRRLGALCPRQRRVCARVCARVCVVCVSSACVARPKMQGQPMERGSTCSCCAHLPLAVAVRPPGQGTAGCLPAPRPGEMPSLGRVAPTGVRCLQCRRRAVGGGLGRVSRLLAGRAHLERPAGSRAAGPDPEASSARRATREQGSRLGRGRFPALVCTHSGHVDAQRGLGWRPQEHKGQLVDRLSVPARVDRRNRGRHVRRAAAAG